MRGQSVPTAKKEMAKWEYPQLNDLALWISGNRPLMLQITLQITNG